MPKLPFLLQSKKWDRNLESESLNLCAGVMPSLSSRNVILPEPAGVQSPCSACPPLSHLPVCPAISPVKL